MPRHIPSLDSIRGFAILLVMALHFFMSFTPVNATEILLQKICGYGTLGIDIFFVLSGFLITGILLDTKGDPRYLRNFLIRRFLRIFPLYYLVLCLVLIVFLLASPEQQAEHAKVWEAQPWLWTYTFNFFIAREGGWTVPYLGHFWSLAVEEQFYLFWPFVVLYLTRRRLITLCIGLIIAATAGHMVLEGLGFNKVSIHVLTFLRFNALATGALLAAWIREPGIQEKGPSLLKSRAWMLLFVSIFVKFLIVLSVKILPAASTPLEAFRTLSWIGIFAALHLSALAYPDLRLPPLMFLGRYSYGIYIFHHFFSWPRERYTDIGWISDRVGNHTLAVFLHGLGGIAISLLIAWLSYQVFEKRLLTWKDILAPKAPLAKAGPGNTFQ